MTDTTAHTSAVAARALDVHLRDGMTIAVGGLPPRLPAAVVPLTPDEWRQAVLSTFEGTPRVLDA